MLSFILIHYCVSIFALLPSPSTFVDLLIMLILLIPFDACIFSFIYIVLARFSDHTFFYLGAVDSGSPFSFPEGKAYFETQSTAKYEWVCGDTT